MGSVNPVVILPEALAGKSKQIAEMLTQSVTGSSGQFCTKVIDYCVVLTIL
jgi:hypothetical protein